MQEKKKIPIKIFLVTSQMIIRIPFFLSPTNKKEIKIITSSLDINKSNGPYSIQNVVLEMFKNDNFTTGTFPTILKTAKVISNFITGTFPTILKTAKVISI